MPEVSIRSSYMMLGASPHFPACRFFAPVGYAILAACFSGAFLQAQQLPAQVPGTLRLAEGQIQIQRAAARIDEAILKLEQESWLKANGSDPAQKTVFVIPPRVTDGVFIRRVFLDIVGKLPDSNTVRAFEASTSLEKRRVLVDELLSQPMSGARRFLRIADMLRVKDSVMGVSLQPYVAWLQSASANNLPYDQLVSQLISAQGGLERAPETGFLLTDEGQVILTAQEVFRVFLDENLHCATCHDHPYSDATQMDLYRIAATLSSVEFIKMDPRGAFRFGPTADFHSSPDSRTGGQLMLLPTSRPVPLVLPGNYLYRNGKPGEPVQPGLPQWSQRGLERNTASRIVQGRRLERNRALADHIVSSPQFAEVAALRTWREFFGTPASTAWEVTHEPKQDGKSPIEVLRTRSCEESGPRNSRGRWGDQFGQFRFRTASPASRQFAKVLGMEMAAVKFDLRKFERILCYTEAYQRECLMVPWGPETPVMAPIFRRLPAETIWNNMVMVQTDGAPEGRMLLSHELPQVPDVNHPSRLLGRGDRVWGDGSLRNVTHSLVMTLMTGETTRQASAMDGPLVRRLSLMPAPDLAVEEAFLSVVGRLPTYREKIMALDHGVQNPATVWSDLVWSLLNSSEFIFQY